MRGAAAAAGDNVSGDTPPVTLKHTAAGVVLEKAWAGAARAGRADKVHCWLGGWREAAGAGMDKLGSIVVWAEGAQRAG